MLVILYRILSLTSPLLINWNGIVKGNELNHPLQQAFSCFVRSQNSHVIVRTTIVQWLTHLSVEITMFAAWRFGFSQLVSTRSRPVELGWIIRQYNDTISFIKTTPALRLYIPCRGVLYQHIWNGHKKHTQNNNLCITLSVSPCGIWGHNTWRGLGKRRGDHLNH